MIYCTPFLLFDGNCAEAMTFYHQCLGGELTLTKLGDTPMKAQFPQEKHNCRMPHKLSVTGDSCQINCPPNLPGPAIFVTACHKNCPGGFLAFCTDGLSAAKIVFSLQAMAQKLSLAYTGHLPSFLLGGESM